MRDVVCCSSPFRAFIRVGRAVLLGAWVGFVFTLLAVCMCVVKSRRCVLIASQRCPSGYVGMGVGFVG